MSCVECDQPARSKGLCQPHYHRTRRAAINAARSETARIEAEYRLGELEHLLNGGVWPPSAVRRLGWTVTGAEKAARKRGRPDLARALWPFSTRGRMADAS